MELAAVRASHGLSHHTTTEIAWEIHFRVRNGYGSWLPAMAANPI